MYLVLHVLHIQVRCKVAWLVEPVLPLSTNRGRLTVGKQKRLNHHSFLNLTKQSFRIIPRILPESHPHHTSNFPILNLAAFARAELVFREHKSFLRNQSPRAMPPAASEKNPIAAAPGSGTLQWAPTCQLQRACAHHFNCSNLKQHPKDP